CATKGEARAIAADLERKTHRARFGLEPALEECSKTVAELCEWWLASRCNPRRVELERARLQRHVLSTDFGRLSVTAVRAVHVEDVMRAMQRKKLKPRTINGLRGLLFSIF